MVCRGMPLEAETRKKKLLRLSRPKICSWLGYSGGILENGNQVDKSDICKEN